MSSNFDKWASRANHPKSAMVRLGFAAEYWRSNPKLYEGYEQLQEKYKLLGRRVSGSSIAYDLSGQLLSEVITAAGGMEGSLLRLRTAMAALYTYVRLHNWKAHPGGSFRIGDTAAVDAWYAFSEVLMWGRTVIERMDRRAGNSKKFPRQGLLPAIKPKRLKRACDGLFLTLQASAVGRSRPLANFIFHGGLLGSPHTGAELLPSGVIVLPIPELPSQSVPHWYLFSWGVGHDGVALAEEMWRSVETFMDGLLTAFEKAMPKRLRVP